MSDSQNPYDTPPPAPSIDELDFTPSNDDRNLALIAHLSGCAGILVGSLVGFVGPLVLYMMYKDKSPYVSEQAKEALNFQITLFLVFIGCGILTAASCGFLLPVMFVPMVLQVVFGIIAALAVRDGSHYRYPFNVRLVQ